MTFGDTVYVGDFLFSSANVIGVSIFFFELDAIVVVVLLVVVRSAWPRAL